MSQRSVAEKLHIKPDTTGRLASAGFVDPGAENLNVHRRRILWAKCS